MIRSGSFHLCENLKMLKGTTHIYKCATFIHKHEHPGNTKIIFSHHNIQEGDRFCVSDVDE